MGGLHAANMLILKTGLGFSPDEVLAARPPLGRLTHRERQEDANFSSSKGNPLWQGRPTVGEMSQATGGDAVQTARIPASLGQLLRLLPAVAGHVPGG